MECFEKIKLLNKKSILKRILIYIIGVFIFALGVAFSIKSNLGVSPVSSVSFVLSLITKGSVGFISIVFFIGLIMFQWIILRKDFKIRNLSQLIFAIVFGPFVDMSIFMISTISKGSLVMQFFHLALGTFLISLGIYLMIKTNITISPGDGFVTALAIKSGFKFTKLKVSFDLFCTFVSVLLSFVFLKGVYGVGIGTVLCALGVGTTMDLIDKFIGERLIIYLEEN
ncbi:DUF6198 family protein [uncultured Ilyobacter sp.]|uniref:YczE/YyaS/YitT family protein n=1 Tax=uncultured Ilyobacter sp. TaxID=544433 RepID=UPI002AA95899|nr:DUF6198 family protein [uncultured Ilyobacter sp.]